MSLQQKCALDRHHEDADRIGGQQQIKRPKREHRGPAQPLTRIHRLALDHCGSRDGRQQRGERIEQKGREPAMRFNQLAAKASMPTEANEAAVDM